MSKRQQQILVEQRVILGEPDNQDEIDPILKFFLKALLWLVAVAIIIALALTVGAIALVVGAVVGAGWLLWKSAPTIADAGAATGIALFKVLSAVFIGVTSPIWGSAWLICQGGKLLIEGHQKRQAIKIITAAETQRRQLEEKRQNYELERLRLENEAKKLALLERMADMQPLRGLIGEVQSESMPLTASRAYQWNVPELHEQS